MVPAPHEMAPGTTERDYYANKIVGAHPDQVTQGAGVDEVTS